MTLFNFNCTYITDIRSLDIRPLDILGGDYLVFPSVSPLHFLLLLIGLAMIIIFFYIFIVFSSDGIKVTEEIEIHTAPNLPGQIEGPDDMEVYRPRPIPPISKVKKMVKKIKEKVKK